MLKIIESLLDTFCFMYLTFDKADIYFKETVILSCLLTAVNHVNEAGMRKNTLIMAKLSVFTQKAMQSQVILVNLCHRHAITIS